MKPLRPRYSRVRREVSELLARFSVSAPPVPVEDIARGLGAKVSYSNFDNEISGLLVRRAGSIVIGVASEQPENRQRFTIAHEIGHLLLHGEGVSDEVHVDKHFRVHLRSSLSSTAEDVGEIEANAFAAELLMPEAFVRRDAKMLMLDFDDPGQVQELAQAYRVSSQAMTYRLMNLFGAAVSN